MDSRMRGVSLRRSPRSGARFETRVVEPGWLLDQALAVRQGAYWLEPDVKDCEAAAWRAVLARRDEDARRRAAALVDVLVGRGMAAFRELGSPPRAD
jgi:hypothetical protein